MPPLLLMMSSLSSIRCIAPCRFRQINPNILLLPNLKRFRGRAVRQSSAKASTAVRICSEPPSPYFREKNNLLQRIIVEGYFFIYSVNLNNLFPKNYPECCKIFRGKIIRCLYYHCHFPVISSC